MKKIREKENWKQKKDPSSENQREYNWVEWVFVKEEQWPNQLCPLLATTAFGSSTFLKYRRGRTGSWNGTRSEWTHAKTDWIALIVFSIPPELCYGQKKECNFSWSGFVHMLDPCTNKVTPSDRALFCFFLSSSSSLLYCNQPFRLIHQRA